MHKIPLSVDHRLYNARQHPLVPLTSTIRAPVEFPARRSCGSDAKSDAMTISGTPRALSLACFLSATALSLTGPTAAAPSIAPFPSKVAISVARSREIDYTVDPTKERFLVVMPATRAPRYGVVVYTSPGDGINAPPNGWAATLDRRHLIFIAPQGVGNGTPNTRRYGMAVIAALEAQQIYPVDSNRIYAAGLSGGARVSCDLGFYQSDLFHGTIQDCGADFYRKVDAKLATSQTDTNGHPYGTIQVPPSLVTNARNNQKFVLITGTNDFRHGNMLDLFAGFQADGFSAKLIDVPRMGHEDCNGSTLEQALQFIEGH
jgi:hypothetical protein